MYFLYFSFLNYLIVFFVKVKALKTFYFFINISVVFILLTVLYSCKKEIEDIPKVSFIYPHENTFYNVGDTVETKIKIESISNIKSIEIKLVNNDLVPVSNNYNYKHDGSNNITVNYAFIINDYYMQSGDYQILCKVENENDVKRKYQRIKINSVAKELENIAVVCQSPGKVKVYNLTTGLTNSSLKFEVNGDYSSSTYLPFHHRFAIAGSVHGSMICWDYFTEDTIQIIPYSANPPFPFFSSLDGVNDFLAVGYYQGAVDLFNYTAFQKFSIAMETYYYPLKLFDLGEHFMINEKQINGDKNLISIRLSNTTSQYASLLLPGILLNAFPFENNDDMLFFNDGNMGAIGKYVYQDNAINKLIMPYSEKFISVAQIDKKNYLISTATNLLWYQYQISSLTSIINNVSLENLHYDNVTGRLYATHGKTIDVYSIPNGNLLNSITLSEEIAALHLIYNK